MAKMTNEDPCFQCPFSRDGEDDDLRRRLLFH